jgi:hypothetical protein
MITDPYLRLFRREDSSVNQSPDISSTLPALFTLEAVATTLEALSPYIPPIKISLEERWSSLRRKVNNILPSPLKELDKPAQFIYLDLATSQPDIFTKRQKPT